MADTDHGATIDDLDLHSLIDLVEKTVCCLGQTNVAINFHRRLNVMSKLTNDNKKSKHLLRKNEGKMANSGAKLFGEDFRRELKKLGKEKRNLFDLMSALGPAKKRRFSHNNNSSNNTAPVPYIHSHSTRGSHTIPDPNGTTILPSQEGPPATRI